MDHLQALESHRDSGTLRKTRRERSEHGTHRTPALWAFSGVAAVISVLLAIWTIRTGHEGAKVTWSGVL